VLEIKVNLQKQPPKPTRLQLAKMEVVCKNHSLWCRTWS